MNKFGDFPFLVGVTSNRHAVKLENSTEAVADFICTKGVDGDLCILTPDGDKVLNTYEKHQSSALSAEITLFEGR